MLLGQTYQGKVSSAEATWLLKVAEEDMALRDCGNVSLLLQKMFPEEFTMSKNMASDLL